MFNAIIAAVFVIMFAGCTASDTPATSNFPSWYLNPPHNSASTLYGTGSGSDLPSAKNAALNAISSSLSVTIEGKFEKSDHSIRTDRGEQTLQDVLNTVKADTKALTFTNARVEQNSIMGNTVLVLVSVDRSQLFNEQKEKLDTTIASLKSSTQRAPELSHIERFVLLKDIRSRHETIAANAELLSAIKPGFDNRPYFAYITETDNWYEALKSSLNIRITSDTEAFYFIAPISDALTAEGIKVDTASKGTTLALTATTQQDDIFGFKIEKVRLSTTLKTASGKIIASRQHTVSGKSRYDHIQARHQAAKQFRAEIHRDGIFSILGL